MKNVVAVVLLVLLSTPVFGAYNWPTSQDDENVAVLMENNVKDKTSAFSGVSSWSKGGEPCDLYDYWIPAGRTVYLPSANCTFAGKSLTSEAIFLGSTKYVTFAHLRFKNGGGYSQHANGILLGVDSEVTIESTSEKPTVFECNRAAGNTFHYLPILTGDNGKLIGAADAELDIRHAQNGMSNAIRLGGTGGTQYSDYFGLMKICRTNTSLSKCPEAFFEASVYSGPICMPGTLELGTGVHLLFAKASYTVTLGGLTVRNGSKLTSCGAGSVTVTNRFAANAGAILVRSKAGSDYDYSNRFAFVTLRGAAAQRDDLPSPEKFVLANPGPNFYGLDAGFGYETDADDPTVKHLMLRRGRPLRKSLTGDGPDRSKAEGWEGGIFPTAEENGWLLGTLTLGPEYTDYVFPGGGLVCDGSSKTRVVQLNCATLTVTNLFVAGEATLEANAKSVESTSTTWQGRDASVFSGEYLGLANADARLSFAHAQGRFLVVDAPIYGEGRITCSSRNGTSYPQGACELTRINENFTGYSVIASDNGNAATNSVTGLRHVQYMTDARNLGGAMKGPTWNGLTLRGDSIIVGRKSLDFSQANRGVYVQDRIRVVMTNEADNVFTLGNSLTYGGEFVFGNDYPTAKSAAVGKGGGTLVLAAPAKFYDAENKAACDTPTADCNRLTMLIGKLRPEHAGALDGVAVSFGEESEGLEIDAAKAAAMPKGFLSVKDGSSITVANAKLTVNVINLVGNEVDVPVCTVPSAGAAALAARMVRNRSMSPYRATFTVEDNGDGATSTIVAHCYRSGLVLMVR